MKYDLRTKDGLRSACRQAESRFDDPHDLAAIEDFLRTVKRTPDTDRNNERFLHLIWDENPIAGVGAGNFDVQDALADPDFRRRFAELTTAPLLEN